MLLLSVRTRVVMTGEAANGGFFANVDFESLNATGLIQPLFDLFTFAGENGAGDDHAAIHGRHLE